MTASGLQPSHAVAPWRRHALLLLLTLLYADAFIGRQIMAVMIEPIKLELGVSDTAMGLISGLAFAAVFALFGLSAGQLADRVSRTRLLAACALLWAVTTFFCGLATGLITLVVARMLVAVAEAPISAASISMIADLYPPQRRAFAISCFSSAPTFAAIVALSGGAWLVGEYGWRSGFTVIAIPGILFALIFLVFIREPLRGSWDEAVNVAPDTKGLRATLLELWRNRSFRLLVLSSAITTMGANAFGMWNATFLVRSHGLELQQAGILAGFIGGGSAAAGMLFSGWFADAMISRDQRWQLWLPQIGHSIGVIALQCYLLWPGGILFYFADLPVPGAILWCALSSFFAVWWVGPSFSYMTRLVAPQRRAIAVSCQTILITLLGIGLGPFTVGLLSDLLNPVLATESLRYGMLFCCLTTLAAMLIYIRLASLHRQQA